MWTKRKGPERGFIACLPRPFGVRGRNRPRITPKIRFSVDVVFDHPEGAVSPQRKGRSEGLSFQEDNQGGRGARSRSTENRIFGVTGARFARQTSAGMAMPPPVAVPCRFRRFPPRTQRAPCHPASATAHAARPMPSHAHRMAWQRSVRTEKRARSASRASFGSFHRARSASRANPANLPRTERFSCHPASPNAHMALPCHQVRHVNGDVTQSPF